MSWRLVLGDGSGLVPLAGAMNMAIDLALLESVQAGGSPVLRFYRWSPACLSFGRNQCARDTYDPVVVAACSIDVVRRPTGGLAVLHDAEVTYSVIAPIGAIGRPREAYVRINAWLVAALREFGVAAVLAPPLARGGVPAGGEPCFARPAAGEVVAGGRKLIGSAQRCERHCILQHGSILLDGDQRRVHRLERVAPGRTTPAGSPA
jgi:lipoyl(octanoyl) transferase